MFENISIKREATFLASLVAIFIALVAYLHLGSSDSNPDRFLNISLHIVLIFIYIIAGKPIIKNAIINFFNRNYFDENTLMFVSTVAAFFIGAYEEAVAVVLFFRVGEFLQEVGINNSKKSIKSLLDLTPAFANKRVGKKIVSTKPENLNIDDIILVKNGERIASDGVVVSGESYIDNSAVNGESMPQKVKVGDFPFGGTINVGSAIDIKITKRSEDSFASRIMHMIENAIEKKSKTENFITKFAKIYTPIVFFFALAVAIFPPIFGFGSFEDWIYRALVVLMVSCPCALVISVPIGYFGGIGAASKMGILFKGANYLEAMGNVKSIIFDKTGTLSEGKFRVNEVYTFSDYSKEEILYFANICEAYSSHPIAKSIQDSYNGKNVELKSIKNHKEFVGEGICCEYKKYKIALGNKTLLKRFKINPNVTHDDATSTSIYVGLNGAHIGTIILSDKLKSDTLAGIKEIRRLGIKNLAILSGV